MREFKYVLLCILLFSSMLFAHEGGHGEPLKKWTIKSTNEVIIADFIKYENDEVWLVDDNHAIHILDIQEFNLADQQYIENKSAFIHSVNSSESFENNHEQTPFTYWMILVLGIVLLVYSIYKIRRRKKILYVAYSILGVGFILFVSCKESNNKNTSSVQVPENNVAEMRTFFEKFEQVETHTDDNFFYISSNGLPKHDMMVGITNWQQQVPIKQNYTGDNSWAIPIHPKLADNPLSTKTNLLKGAIAVAVNGIPIFNPLNNRGEDANAIGELDNWGGHCGRADDYHYHLPPLHLQDQVGEGNPVAYAVDGFPVYGKTSKELDEYLGIMNPDGSYEYHTIEEYPYFIAGMRGAVVLDPKTKAPENQVSPQPRTQELRPALRPLRDAKIIDFKSLSENAYSLIYSVGSKQYIINYKWDSEDNYTYEFINSDGTSSLETYKPRQR